jgi:sulfoxide reductase heme-binding subunit YedZ
MRAALSKALLGRAAKPLLFIVCLAPLGWLVYGAVANRLGANPAEALIRGLGGRCAACGSRWPSRRCAS